MSTDCQFLTFNKTKKANKTATTNLNVPKLVSPYIFKLRQDKYTMIIKLLKTKNCVFSSLNLLYIYFIKFVIVFLINSILYNMHFL